MNIITGIVPSAKKVVIYGPEGIGKSTLAAQFPNPLFSDTEGSTKELNISRFEAPTSWAMLLEQAKYVRDYRPCKTYVIDTADWAEQLCNKDVCATAGLKGIEDFGWGKGYVYSKENFGKLLNILDEVIAVGINVVFTAHSFLRKVEQPDEMGSYDRYELKMSKHISPLLKEWCDILLFANYKTYVVITDEKSNKGKAQGNKRVMYTTHTASWDAKNRYGLPDMMDFDYKQIAYIFNETPQTVSSAPKQEEVVQAPPQTAKEFAAEQVANLKQQGFSVDEIIDNEPEQQALAQDTFVKEVPVPPLPSDSDDPVIQKLFQLMNEKGMTIEILQATVADAGYYPRETPIENYDKAFVEGCLIGAWDSVCKQAQQYMQVPFN